MTLDRASGRPLSLRRATRPDTTGPRLSLGLATWAASDIRPATRPRPDMSLRRARGRRTGGCRATRPAGDILHATRLGMKLRWVAGRRMGYGSDYGSSPEPADLPLTAPHATCSPMHATPPSRPPAPTVAAGPA